MTRPDGSGRGGGPPAGAAGRSGGAQDRRLWRDAAGRPVPPGSPDAVAQVPEIDRTPDEALTLAQSLLDAGLPFYAHDVLEAAWKAAGQVGAGPTERNLWQGLAQLCVGLTHEQRGNPTGAARLLRRGAGRLAAAAPAHGVQPADVAARALELAEALEAGGASGVGPDRPLRLRP